MTGRGGGDPRIPPPTSRWLLSMRCPLGRSKVAAGGRDADGGARLRSMGFTHDGGGSGSCSSGCCCGGGAVSSQCRHDTVSSALDSNVPIDLSAVVFHDSSPVTLSRICCITKLNPSNFFARSFSEFAI